MSLREHRSLKSLDQNIPDQSPSTKILLRVNSKDEQNVYLVGEEIGEGNVLKLPTNRLPHGKSLLEVGDFLTIEISNPRMIPKNIEESNESKAAHQRQLLEELIR